MDSTTLRPPALGDAEELAALYARNREFLRPFEPDRDDRFFTPDGQGARIDQAAESARAGTRFSYLILDGDGLVARGYLHVGGEWRDHVLFQRLLGG